MLVAAAPVDMLVAVVLANMLSHIFDFKLFLNLRCFLVLNFDIILYKKMFALTKLSLTLGSQTVSNNSGKREKSIDCSWLFGSFTLLMYFLSLH